MDENDEVMMCLALEEEERVARRFWAHPIQLQPDTVAIWLEPYMVATFPLLDTELSAHRLSTWEP
jgi:hypothetical protein